MGHRTPEDSQIRLLNGPHERVFRVRNIFPQQKHAEQGHQRERKQQRPGQRTGHSPCHGGKNPAFMTLQCENRDMRGDNDEHGKERWPANLNRRLFNRLAESSFVTALLQFTKTPEDILNNDHCTIHNNAKVHRSQRKQISRYPSPTQPNESGQQRQRDHKCNDGGSAEVAQKQQQNECHENRALRQILENGMKRCVNQPRAVVIRNNCDTFREDRRIEQLNLRLQRLSTSEGFSPLRMRTIPETISSVSSCPIIPSIGKWPNRNVRNVP